MKSIFDIIYNITTAKKPDQLEERSNFNGFIIQRWLSMHSPESCYILNETYNSNWRGMNDLQMAYDYLILTFPRIGNSKLTYIKKPPSSKNPDVTSLAKKLQISEREASEMIKLDNSLLKKEKTVEVFVK